MSLSGALSNAMSGLNANARGTSVVSSNIANALNENYGARTVVLASNATQSSGGVTVASISRQSDPILAYQKRLAAAELGQATVRAESAKGIEKLWGSVDTLGSVAERLTRFETALSSAATDPSSELRLRNVAHTADAFAASIRSASDGIQSLRESADRSIASIVDTLNVGLQNIENLNKKIELARYTGSDALSHYDQRDAELNRLSEFIPLHVIERDSGVVAVFSKAGQTLLDGSAVELAFSPSPTIMSQMTLASGALSSLSINGREVDSSGDGLLAGGALAAQFDIRDTTAPDVQTYLDGIARDVIDRFGPSGPDATLSPGDAGAFTDAGSVFDPVNEAGLAQRLELNSVLTEGHGETWRWRDGILAAAPGEPGASSLLRDTNAQISVAVTPNATQLGSSARSLVDHVHGFGSGSAFNRLQADETLSFAKSQFASAQEAIVATGVNSDVELQKLIELEKSFAANARVVQVVDDMLSELLRF